MNGHSNLQTRRERWVRISFRSLVVLSMLLGAVLLFILPEMGAVGVIIRFWIVLLIVFGLVWLIVGGMTKQTVVERDEKARLLQPEEEPESVREVMDVQMAAEQSGVQVYRGRLRESSDAV